MKILFLLCLLAFEAWSAVNLRVDFTNTEVKQGSIVNAKIVLSPDSEQNFAISTLEGKTIANSIHFLDLSALMKTPSDPLFYADAKVIVVNELKDTFVTEEINGTKVLVTWNKFDFIPTKSEKELLFGTFEIPKKNNFLIWILSGLAALVVLGTGIFFYQKKQSGKRIRLQKLKLKEEIVSCQNFSEVVSMWQKKHLYLQIFPGFEEDFKFLETTLFKYQFKPNQSPQEVDEVMGVYKEFTEHIKGKKDGV